MADEFVPPAADAITPTPPARPVPTESVAPAPPIRPLAAPVPAPTTIDWLKLEVAHYALACVFGVVVAGGAYFYGFDYRVAALAGIVTVLFGRGITHHFLPEFKADPTAGAATAPPAPPTDTVREIVETIVFVVVLVLLLKSFVAEAFVIPTGSMATTLWGYQKVVKCPECNYEFPVNCASEADPQDGPPIPVRGCICPNCRYSIKFGSESHIDPTWNSGDRVLVAKFLYDLLERSPDRLDVVVFKFPGDSSLSAQWPQSGPFGHNQVPMNYIKRLIGLSGEVIAIHGGDLYRIPADKVPDEVREHFARDAEKFAGEKYNQAWRKPGPEFGEPAKEFFNKYRNLFEIIRKPPDTMLAMRRIVYDNDFPARDLPPDRGWARWTGGAWKAEGNAFRHGPGAGADGTDWLRYRHVLRTGEAKPQLITDFMGYNTPIFGNTAYGRTSGLNWVSDLMVECEAKVDAAQGELTLELSRGADRFQARIDVPTGVCKLFRITGKEEKELASQPTSLKKPGTYQLRFADFDDRLTVWVGNDLPFGAGVNYDPPRDFGPVEANDLDRPVSIGCRGATVRLDHLQVWRDTYYTVGESGPSDGDAGSVRFDNPKDWDRLQDLPFRVTRVRPGHYLCLGDNSPESSDGRTWGLVPDRLLLGRALLVYWPAARAGRIR